MNQGSNHGAEAPPTMIRAFFSAALLICGLFFLAKLVVRPDSTPKNVSPRVAERNLPVKPTAQRLKPRFRVLGTYAQRRRVPTSPLNTRRSRPSLVTTVSDKDHPIRLLTPSDEQHADENSPIPAELDYACGTQQIVHQVEIDLVDPESEENEAAPFKLRTTPKLYKRRGRQSPPEPNAVGEQTEDDKDAKSRRVKPAAKRRRQVAKRANSKSSDRKPAEKQLSEPTEPKQVDKKTGKKTPPIAPPETKSEATRTPHRNPAVPAESNSTPEEMGRELLLMESKGWHVDRELDDAMLARRDRIRKCLDFYYDRPLHNLEDSSWSMMHHMIAWGVDSRILVKNQDGSTKRVSTIGWMCGNGVCKKNRLLFAKDGRLQAKTGPGLQGHDGQFLAMLAQARVSRHQKLLVDGQEFTVDDLIREEQLACRPRTELTFRLIGMAHYLPIDTTWKNQHGQEWSIQRLVEEELRQPINGTTCGGTHRLMGFTYAVERRRLSGQKIDGPWATAELVAKRHRNLAFRMQNRDGSFSSDFFRSAGSWGDMNRKLKTSGHVLEWLVFSVPPAMLEDPRILMAVDYVCHLLTVNRYYDWENGPLGHAVRALSLYDERVYGRRPGKRDLQMADKRPRLVPRTTAPSRPPQKNNARSTPRLFRRR